MTYASNAAAVDSATDASPLSWVKRLVQLDTTSAKGNLPVIDLLEQVFSTTSAQVRRFNEPDGKNANLLVSFPARDGSLDGGILLAGHADCVPVDGQVWDTPPFEPTIRDNRLFGRGTADMKSFLAVAAALATEFAEADLATPIHIAATWDEETTCDGARALVAQLSELGIHPRVAFVGEPSSMRAIGAHKSMNVLRVRFKGIAAHSSLLPQGLNAIRYAADFISWFSTEIIDEQRINGPRDDAFVVPFTTGGVNLIRGGVAQNTVPEDVELSLEFRALPEVDPRVIVAQIEAKIAEISAQMRSDAPADAPGFDQVGAELEIVTLLYPLASGPESEAAQLAVQLGAHFSADKVTYGTEAGIYEHAGMSAVVVGPGDIAQAHGPNEFIELSQIDECTDFFRNIIRFSAQK